eukprot:scaffold495_cov243-Pinguiococcus_pyrenoidosus.AAC.45
MHAAPALRAAHDPAVEALGGLEVVHWEGVVEGGDRMAAGTAAAGGQRGRQRPQQQRGAKQRHLPTQHHDCPAGARGVLKGLVWRVVPPPAAVSADGAYSGCGVG